MEREIRKGKYRHYKGGFYWVVDVARHSETNEELVIYRCSDNLSLYARPKKMFLEDIVIEGKSVPRFKFISYS